MPLISAKYDFAVSGQDLSESERTLGHHLGIIHRFVGPTF